MKTFASWSGGKESALSLYRVTKDKDIDMSYLLNMISEDGTRSRTHGIGSRLLKKQASAIGTPIIQRKTVWENYEREFKKAVAALKREGIASGVFGDIDMQEHRDWVERVCRESDIEPILPLWGSRREELLEEFIEAGFKAVIVATNADFLGGEFLGHEINEELIMKLRALGNVDLCGEKGEYHTLVYDGPIFKKPLKFSVGGKIFKDGHWFLEVTS